MVIAVAGNAFAVQFTTTNTTHTTAGITTQAAGSTFVVGVGGGGTSGTINSVTDNKGNTYTRIQSQVNSAGSGAGTTLFYCENAAGGAAHTFTAVTSGSDVKSIAVIEVTGGLLTGILDQSAAGIEDTSSPFTSNTTGATTQARELAVAFAGTDTVSGTEVITWGNGFTGVVAGGDANFVTIALAAQILTSTQTVTSSMTSSGAGSTGAVSFVATFKEAAAAATPEGKRTQSGPGVSPDKRKQFRRGFSGSTATATPNATDLAALGTCLVTGTADFSTTPKMLFAAPRPTGPGISPDYRKVFRSGRPMSTTIVQVQSAADLAAAGLALVSGSAALTTAIQLTASGSGDWTATAAMGAFASLAADARLEAQGAASLSTQTGFAADGRQAWNGSSTLTTVIVLSADGRARWRGDATIVAPIALAADGSGRFSAAASLQTAIQFAAASLGRWAGAAAFSQGAVLAGDAYLQSHGAAALSTATLFAADAKSQFSGSAALTVQVHFQASGYCLVTGTAQFNSEYIAPYQLDPRFLITHTKREFKA